MIKYLAISSFLKNNSFILFNLSLSKSEFPTQWKIASVLPLFKKGDKSLISNYRPISLLSAVGKVFERIVFKE
jgi:hypothetical protein